MLKTALQFIWYDKPKSIGALAGTILSVFLIGQQAGIFIFLTNLFIPEKPKHPFLCPPPLKYLIFSFCLRAPLGALTRGLQLLL